MVTWREMKRWWAPWVPPPSPGSYANMVLLDIIFIELVLKACILASHLASLVVVQNMTWTELQPEYGKIFLSATGHNTAHY